MVALGPYRAEITCHKYTVHNRGNQECVGTTYPNQAPLTQRQAATKVQAAFRGLTTRRVYSKN